MKNKQFSQKISVFHERAVPETGTLIGYGALIEAFRLKVPLPDKISLISDKHRKYETDEWLVFTPRYLPQDDLGGHLTFALKHEGIDLHVLKALFEAIDKKEIEKLILNEPQGRYNRKLWFLYEWFFEKKLNIPDLKQGNFVELVDTTIQYAGTSENSTRHRIKNNLPGVNSFCPMIRKTAILEEFKHADYSKKIETTLSQYHKDILLRAASFLLLQDSKASFAIEGEKSVQSRALRWGRAIGQAGLKPISKEELLHLQEIVIESSRFIKMGWRKKGGFIGGHDRYTFSPVPGHISARPQDLDSLISGLIRTKQKLQSAPFDPVLAAAMIAFGFVFIHPFVDGNGRIHRYLIHHVLSKMNFSKQGIVFPVSAAMLTRITEYRKALEDYSQPRLDLIEWKETNDHNVEVLNDTIDLYRYFDATKQAEFLCSCVKNTVEEIIPKEVEYLVRFDEMKHYLETHFEVPDKTVSLLIRFLEQGEGKLSERAKKKEFNKFTAKEIASIEKKYQQLRKS
ncbi:MAG: Fic family protein [Bacteroidales bacterium]|nr:Fic family protein [Lentimicrobiaceae bacterium]MDD5695870.1 Fic family protein [Bacteroidales bacterium]